MRHLILACLIGLIGAAEPAQSGDDLRILAPLAHQVLQRDTPARIRLEPSAGVANWRLVPLAGAFGSGGTDWAPLDEAGILMPAGGWYRLEVRRGQQTARVEPIGVGEVFVIAGQSYADNCSEERLRVGEPQGRVAAFDLAQGAWGVAHDPQPNAASAHRDGSIWPAFGDELVRRLRVPVGLVNVARAATSSQDWMPGGDLHRRLIQAAKGVGRFRAVLWQQGESDVMKGVPAADYVARLRAIRAELAQACGTEIAWLPAKSTIHPAVYRKPAQEAEIRSAIDQLWRSPGFVPGPDTDSLTGENRANKAAHEHFSAIGQRRAALLWAAAVADLVGRPAPATAAFVTQLQAGQAQTIVLYGTSLTANTAWGRLLQQDLDRRFPRLATVVNSGKGSMWSQWGVDNLDNLVIAKKPDAVFIEFAINDAYLPYRCSQADCRRNLAVMLDRIQAARPACQVVLMTMNQPTGPHLAQRPDFAAYYEVYRQVARERGLLLVDHLPAWLRIQQDGQTAVSALMPDGIHPNAAGCARVTLPGILAALGLKP